MSQTRRFLPPLFLAAFALLNATGLPSSSRSTVRGHPHQSALQDGGGVASIENALSPFLSYGEGGGPRTRRAQEESTEVEESGADLVSATTGPEIIVIPTISLPYR